MLSVFCIISRSAANIGVMLVRGTAAAQQLVRVWLQMLLDDKQMWDQNGFNMLVRRNLHTHHQRPAKGTRVRTRGIRQRIGR